MTQVIDRAANQGWRSAAMPNYPSEPSLHPYSRQVQIPYGASLPNDVSEAYSALLSLSQHTPREQQQLVDVAANMRMSGGNGGFLVAPNALYAMQSMYSHDPHYYESETRVMMPFPDSGSPRKHSKERSHIKRPMNSFMIFGQRHRALIQRLNPGKDNKAISKILGDMWFALSSDERQEYVNIAKELADAHKRAFPEWKFKRTVKKRKSSLPVPESLSPQGGFETGIERQYCISSTTSTSTATTPRSSSFTECHAPMSMENRPVMPNALWTLSHIAAKE